MILNALAGDPLPVYGDGRNVRNWLFVEDFARGIGHALEHGRPGRGLQLRRPGRVREHRRGQADRGALRRGRVADRVRHRPPRPRPPLLARLRQADGARVGAARPLRGGPRADGRSGIATTRGGGSRSARASIATTTSASTAARSSAERAMAAATALVRQPGAAEVDRAAGAARVWSHGARRSLASSGPRTPNEEYWGRPAARLRRSAARDSLCSGSRPRPTAATGPGGSSPATAPATGCSRRCGARGMRTSHSRSRATTG